MWCCVTAAYPRKLRFVATCVPSILPTCGRAECLTELEVPAMLEKHGKATGGLGGPLAIQHGNGMSQYKSSTHHPHSPHMLGFPLPCWITRGKSAMFATDNGRLAESLGTWDAQVVHRTNEK